MSRRGAQVQLVYVAGRYTDPDPYQCERNVRAAEDLAHEVMRLGNAWPVVPHSNTRPYFIGACSYEHALAGTLEMMRRCDAVIFVPGWERSNGARGERAQAELLRLPRFDSIADLARWLVNATHHVTHRIGR